MHFFERSNFENVFFEGEILGEQFQILNLGLNFFFYNNMMLQKLKVETKKYIKQFPVTILCSDEGN